MYRHCFPCPSPSPSKFTIVSMEIDRLTDRMGSETILTCQIDRHYVHNVNLTERVTDTDTETVREIVRVNRP